MTLLPERFGLGISNCRTVKSVLAGVRQAEEGGAEVAFVAEDVNCRDAFELLALAASQTGRIRLSTGVVNPYTRNPTSLAMAIATLDEISQGRAQLGLGTSSPSLIEGQMGIPVGKPVAVMRETTEIVRALLSGQPVDYRGSRFTYRSARLEVEPVQRRIPLYFAGMGPLMLRLAGKLADGVLLNVGASLAYIRWAAGEIAQGARAVGRDPGEITIAAWMTVYVGDDRTASLTRAREWLAAMLSIPRQGELLLERGGFDSAILPDIRVHLTAYPHAGDRSRAAQYVPSEVAEAMTLIGTPQEVRQRLDQYREAGVQIPVLPITAIRALA